MPHLPGYMATADGRVIRPDGSPVKGNDNGAGYLYFSVSRKLGVCRTQAMHVAICAAYHGPKPFPGSEVRHLDDDKRNNLPGNLAWGTNVENKMDIQRNGGRPQGKVNRDDVAEIRRLASAEPETAHERAVGHVNYCKIGRQFGITGQAVQYIVRRAVWNAS